MTAPTENEKLALTQSATDVSTQLLDLMKVVQPPFRTSDQSRIEEQAGELQQAALALTPVSVALMDKASVSVASKRVSIAGHYLDVVIAPGDNDLDRNVIFGAVDAAIQKVSDCMP